MSNEDRIRNWRARRKAEAVGSEADRVAMEGTAIAHAAADDLLPLPAPATELLAVVLDALASVAFGSIADRRRVYDALEREQQW